MGNLILIAMTTVYPKYGMQSNHLFVGRYLAINRSFGGRLGMGLVGW